VSKNIAIAPPKLPIASLSGGRSSLIRTMGASTKGRRWKATIDVRLPLLFSNQVIRAGGLARAVMDVVLLEGAKDLFFEIRGTRTLVQSLDRREADQVEGGI
jgi:hypothetical protein